MKKLLLCIILLFSVAVFGQNEQLANNYFEKGEFEKALVIYEQLDEKQPTNTFIAQRMAAAYQQLEQYDKAQKLLLEKLEKTNQPILLVELGYNHQLQKNTAEAEKYYKQALDAVAQNPSYVYNVANNFEKKVLVKEALQAYETAMEINKSLNFDYQMALLQGQLGNMDLMIENLLNYAYKNQQNLPIVQNQLSRFMNEESPETFNTALRKALLVNTQKNQDIFWNQFLSWFFVQQRDYGKAFIQERAIYKREPDSFLNIVALAELTVEEGENETASEILNFILENTQEPTLQMQAHSRLLKIDIAAAQEKDYPAIQKRIDDLLAQFGVSPYSLDLQVLKADFDAFYMKNPDAGIAALNTALKLQLNKYQAAEVKMKLSDILLLEEKFNQAIIYYAQIEEDLKNDAVGHEASLKVAKSTYFKGDFEWAQKQLKVLKSSSSQLIANDALELFLLITDNTVEDSTQTALKKFARADFKLYQNKKAEALIEFKDIIANDKTESIQDVTLLRIGKIYETQGQYDLALQYYQEIINKYAEGIYIDEALFFSAEIYDKKLQDPEKAKPLYEKVLFEHQDSIYFVEARKEFRKLRGDTAS
ncbi:tetratricopeptide repeat protein [Flavobacterium salilacus subsp. salilacus]|uniref:tetratricopeptide repeat protein n=1 Tax=Flavobacterium TaxID=237 RepID=UPI0010751FF2|nr:MULTISPECIES: tetratricopeptide repeat protein [Flavobacterium]KAF2518846.1 tetratricopeptide repeat protein [Flavobacterium salilacus subsp. salilacus]MBE1614995.1 tetratricopeptide repeat protein [Flavobacterium sp. SaA2.13]